MRMRDVASFLAFFVMIVSVLGYLGSLGLRVNPPSARTDLTMDVPDVNGIVVGSNVLLRGAPVGKVVSTGTSVRAATIGFYVDSRYRIPVDTEVRLENLSALGESYIELRPHSDGGPMLQGGQRISTESIVQPPSISELSTSVVRVLNQLDPDALARIISESDTALPDPNNVLPNLSRASTLLNNTVNDMNGQGRQLLSNFQTLLRNAEWVNPTLTSLAPKTQGIGRGMQDFYKHIPIVIHRGEPANVGNLNNLVARIQVWFPRNRGGFPMPLRAWSWIP
ncbi:Mammalian cell entry related domain protein [Mycolicibacterium rhodesiae JS60]|nr:Mammalian cell entry related domain protein [Mycolicibacterium rhodesiae JS60]